MQTLTYGRKVPESGDDSTGLTGWMKAVESNTAIDDAHTHDGSDSPRITSQAIDAYTTTTGTGWSLQSNGIYRITMSMPVGRDFDKYHIQFKTSAGQQVYLDVVKVSSSSFYVYSNDNTANYTVFLLS